MNRALAPGDTAHVVFGGQYQDQVTKLIAGNNIYISTRWGLDLPSSKTILYSFLA